MWEFLSNDKGLSLKLSTKPITFQQRDDTVRVAESKQGWFISVVHVVHRQVLYIRQRNALAQHEHNEGGSKIP